ncbi:NPCBM/NEW2 domain-containing protein [Streptomyces cylindrosporus]|uniref:NPCBM/NEW2 domain-containing protein n=1 Tax=Streptomyces cylindrosporus TaxID=2927583 RepID=A0ABS9YI91_9ACTN|nr:NPCBM/NEW2 domain-containing protein [Streptomyces cylindrosporus]MCI3276934.1 NPCBM/NEW2 domain-containing protein [Streptomyces cylindrosporus]
MADRCRFKTRNGAGAPSGGATFGLVFPRDAAARLTAAVGIDDEVAPYGSVSFVVVAVVADGHSVTTVPVLTGDSQAASLGLEVCGVQDLHLVVQDSAGGNARDDAGRADARLICAG